MFKKIKIYFLKKKAISLVAEMDKIVEDYDCGVNLVRYYSSQYCSLENKMSEILEKLKKLDKEFPEEINENTGETITEEKTDNS